jgi:hypothetical protein
MRLSVPDGPGPHAGRAWHLITFSRSNHVVRIGWKAATYCVRAWLSEPVRVIRTAAGVLANHTHFIGIGEIIRRSQVIERNELFSVPRQPT